MKRMFKYGDLVKHIQDQPNRTICFDIPEGVLGVVTKVHDLGSPEFRISQGLKVKWLIGEYGNPDQNYCNTRLVLVAGINDD
jgi:hypothetical protein